MKNKQPQICECGYYHDQKETCKAVKQRVELAKEKTAKKYERV